MPTYVLSIDQGTTSRRAILFDERMRVAAIGQEKFARNWAPERRFEPAMSKSTREAKYAGWKDALRRTLSAAP